MISVIFKGGDDCRQESLAMQLIVLFDKIFRDAKLPLFLQPYTVMVTSVCDVDRRSPIADRAAFCFVCGVFWTVVVGLSITDG